MTRSLFATVTLVLAVCASACVSVLPEPEAPDALFRIEAKSAGPVLPQSLVIREPEAPRLFAGAAIVSEDATGALRLVPGAEWAGTATRQLQLALVDSFALNGAGAALLPESGVRAAFQLSSRIQTLGLVEDVAVCEISVSLVTASDRSLVAQTKISVERMPASLSGRDRAYALKQAAENCVADIAVFAAEGLAQ